jgi:uncharacterized repeat protein (TIGR01451 family)
VPPAPEPRGDAAPPPAGPQENAAVLLEWLGPAAVQVGQPTNYNLVVRNASLVTVREVAVHVRPAAGMAVTAMKTDAVAEGETLVWKLGTLLPSQEKTIPLQLLVRSRGEHHPQAWVSFSGTSSVTLHLKAHEAKLTLRNIGPAAKVLVGDTAAFALTVTNAGDGPAQQVKLSALLSDGLEHAGGHKADFELGNLNAGESRTVQLVCTARAGGSQGCKAQALAHGEVKAEEQSTVNVLTPLLELQAYGPAVRYRERKATYTFRVRNGGDIPAGNVAVTEVIPAGFKFVGASDGGLYDPTQQTVTWFLGEMVPEQTRDVEAELVAVQAGDHMHRVTAYSERGLNKIEVRRELPTHVEELSALLLETADADDPIEVGKETTYEALVTNAGSTTETDIRVVCTIPDKMELKSVQASCRYHVEGNVVTFEPLPKLGPRGDVCYRFRVRARAPGDVRFKAQVTSARMAEPIIKTEATRIYADNPSQAPALPPRQ